MMATAADYVIAEVEELVELGTLPPMACTHREFSWTLFSGNELQEADRKENRAKACVTWPWVAQAFHLSVAMDSLCSGRWTVIQTTQAETCATGRAGKKGEEDGTVRRREAPSFIAGAWRRNCRDGYYVNLGIALRPCVANYIQRGWKS